MSPTDPGPVPTEPFDVSGDLPEGTVLLEASAGTGKTWTIAALVTRYVAEGVATLEELLVVTFTRAASQELRERVRDQLVAAERALRDPAAARQRPDLDRDALLTHLLDADDAALAERHGRLRSAVAAFDGATIATIHQFCQLVLRSLGVAGDTDGDATLVEDLDDLTVEVVDDLYAARFAGDPEPPPFDRATALALARDVMSDPRALVSPRQVLDEDPTSPAATRVRFAEKVREEVARRKRRLGVLSYDDLLGQLADALASGTAAGDRMRRRWKIALIDEFQDTDPVQWEVFARAFHGASTLVLIGDPKQAIYAFRGGDVVTYLEAASAATRRQTLTTNHRSDPALVRRLAALFGGAALGDERIVVRPVQARPGVPDSRLTGAGDPLRLRFARGEEVVGSPERALSADACRQHVVRDLALDVQRLLGGDARLDDRPVGAGDVAVLAYGRRDLGLVRDALREVGVRAVVSGGESVFHTPAAAAWLTLLEALEQPHRGPRVRAAALTPFLGTTVADLDAGPERMVDGLAERMRGLADLMTARGVAAVLEACVLDGLTGRVLGSAGGERLLTDLRHVGEALHRVSVTERIGVVGLVAWLREQIADPRNEGGPERTRRLESDSAAVQLVTIHSSKGLQYPIVYLPTLWNRWTGGVDPHPVFHDDEGRRCIDVSGGGPHHQRAKKRFRTEDAGESLRLLYVAATRAQSQVVAWWAPTKTNTGPAPLHRMLAGRPPGGATVPDTVAVPPPEELVALGSTWRDAGALSPELAVHQDVAPGEAEAERPELAVRRFTRSIDGDWGRRSYSGLSSAAAPERTAEVVLSEPEDDGLRDDEPEADPDAPPVPGAPGAPGREGDEAGEPVGDDPGDPGGLAAVSSPMAGLPVGARFGSLVHAVLEHADPAADDWPAELRRHVTEQRAWWPVDLDEEELVAALVAACDSPLGALAGGRTLRELPLADRLRELDFELPLAGGEGARPGSGSAPRVRLGSLAPLLRRHLPGGDPLRGYADTLDADPGLADQLLRGYLTGSIDVVLRVPDGAAAASAASAAAAASAASTGASGASYLTVDYKTNWLGDAAPGDLSAHDYRPAALDAAMGHSDYPLQALLYQVVLHRFLRWRVAGYDPERHLGGVLYLYLRGMCGPGTPAVDGRPCGVFAWRPPVALVTDLSDLLDGEAP